MEQYLSKTRLAGWADSVGLKIAVFICCCLWFFYLWGVSWASLAAGSAFALMVFLAIRLGKKRTVDRREKALRQRIGGELAMEEIMLVPPRQAHFQAALWLSAKYPLRMERVLESGIVCRLKEEKLLVALINCHPSQSIECDAMIGLKRVVKEQGLDRGIACVTSKVSTQAQGYAKEAQQPIRIVSREEMINLAGACSPATDEQLVDLGKRKHDKRGREEWIRHVLSRQRTKQYVLYGLGLIALYAVTRLSYYLVPGVTLMCLALLSRIYPLKKEQSL